MTPPTDLTRWPDVKRIFEAAIDCAPAERSALLDRECRTSTGEPDRVLRESVVVLLDADSEAATGLMTMDGFLASPALVLDRGLSHLAKEMVAPPPEAEPGSRFGPYRVVRLLGRGGMGEVYLAERSDGLFERMVALKRVRTDLAEDVAARFSTERQILADLDHSGIARLYGAGIDLEKGPWLALELVDGVPITDVAAKLSLDERVALLANVAETVHYAHRRLVVHRDLKPSNVLVTDGEDGRQIKLLDFGIATILGLDSDASLGENGSGSPLTRAYAAPEQLRGEAVTTATDVYGLGVLLYEVLAGRRPFGSGRDAAAADAVPPPPSTVVASGGVERQRLQGDLDAICRKALAPEPEERYASAQALAVDLRHVLAHEPVAARAPTPMYRIRRFIRRHRAGVGAAALVVLLLVAGTAFYTVRLAAERDRAELAAEEADRTADFLESLFSDSDPTGADPGDRTARDLLDIGDARIRDELADEPGVLAGLLATIGRVHRTLGRYPEADTALRDAVALYEQTGKDPIGQRDALLQLANLRFRTETYGEAEQAALQALRLDSLHARGADASDRLAILNTLGLIYHETKRLDEAVRVLTTVVEGRRGTTDEETSIDLASNITNLGSILLDLKRPAEALRLFDESVTLVKQHRGDVHPYVAFALHARAGAHEDLDDLASAEADERKALEIGDATLGPEHPFCVQVRGQLAELVARRAASGA